MSVSGGSVTISELTPSTTYSIEVAAVNYVGTGTYSTILHIQGIIIHVLCSQVFWRSMLPHHVVFFTSQVCLTNYAILLLLSLIYFHAVLVPVLSVSSTTVTSISLSWTSTGSVVDYEVMWQRDTSGECPDMGGGSTTITDSSTSYDIMGLEEDSNYTITVTATDTADSSAVSDAVSAITMDAGER